ncbi:MAG: serine/threonine protein kinase [Deltaproteobacteria bacterium]|nr:serine/threonine protein kinase [Deltaproteobacteria bacterium]
MATDLPDPQLPGAATPAGRATGGHTDSFPIHRLPQHIGRYNLTKRLGVGGMAEVFLAQQDGPAGFHKVCVVKRMLPHLAEEPRFVEMFQREARLAALLHHTNVVQIYELGETDGAFFIAMEYVDGMPLHRLARASWRANRPLPMEVVCCALADAALGLAAAHEQCDEHGQPLRLVHRDISPDNLIVNREGVTKVLDFGVAKSTQGERTATGELKGKVPFLSPEQIRGDAIDGRSDLYALGVTAYWLLTGKRPFTAPSDLGVMQAVLADTPRPPRALNPTVPEPLDELVMRLLEKDAGRRPQSGHEVADVLAPALAVRRTIVGPFVREALATEATNPPIEESGPANPGFLPSTPHSDEVRANLRRMSSPRLLPAAAVRPAPGARGVAEETSPTEPVAGDPSSVASVATLPVGAADRQGRGALIAATLGGVVLIAAAITFVVTRGDTEPDVRPVAVSPTPAPTVPPAPSPAEPTPPPLVVPPPDPTPIDAAAPDPLAPADGKRVGEPKLREIAAAGPKWVQWQTKAGKRLGSGTSVLAVPAGVSQIVALDTRRGGRSVVDVKGGAADYGKLPRGKLQVRAAPFADVFLGSEALGTTPFAPVELVEGSYVVVFRHGGKEQKEKVEVKGGQTVRSSASFE